VRCRFARRAPLGVSSESDTRRQDGPQPGRNGPRPRPGNTRQGPQSPVSEAQPAGSDFDAEYVNGDCGARLRRKGAI